MFKDRQQRERIIRSLFFGIALASITSLFLIALFLFIEGVPIFKVVSVPNFLFGRSWYPTSSPPDFGIFSLIMASLVVTVALKRPRDPPGGDDRHLPGGDRLLRLREVVKPIVELLAALPSVVIGFFGMVVVAPFLQDVFDIPTGLNLFNASLMLAFMSIPTICSISEDAIYSVSKEIKEASLALGATHWQTIYRVIIPASLSGITTAIILGMSRAIGETMVVLMVAGGATRIPTSIFDPVRPMPASIAAELEEAPFRSNHYHALFAIGIVLFCFTLIFNIIADHVAHKYKQVGTSTL